MDTRWMDEIAARRRVAARETDRNKDYALLVDRLIADEAPLLWQQLKANVRQAVDHWRDRCAAGPEDVVVYSEPANATFLVERTFGGRASAVVNLVMRNRIIHVACRRRSEERIVESEDQFRFDSDGERVFLAHNGQPLELDLAVEKLVGPVIA